MSNAFLQGARRLGASATLFVLSALCGCSWVTAASCEGRARQPLDQLQEALLPYLDKSHIASVDRHDGCDSGDGPSVTVVFRPRVSRDDGTRGLAGSPWTRLPRPQAREYEHRIGTVVYLRTRENRRMVLVAEGPTNADPEAGLWVYFDDSEARAGYSSLMNASGSSGLV
ncbi:hypothetical protein E1200_00885 [Actinomadura sp. GC306]|uniref:hypothetical protein n=1 Tax=Actinomadura sp. GC306 TaxID=2530367 RepID=UPI00104C49F4|nr:hypothetical protein [Actinomadura sp. GC306]TDC71796.1 hypothetical protein E1200_00885 [Actinomadura sp. GC306]